LDGSGSKSGMIVAQQRPSWFSHSLHRGQLRGMSGLRQNAMKGNLFDDEMPTLEELRQELERYTVLRDGIRDPQMKEIIKQRIEETQANIAQLEREKRK
jgi:hypothetical protein